MRMKKLLTAPLALVVALLFCTSPAFSQNGAKLFDPPTISLRVLPNGVRGIVHENPGSDLVSVQVWVRAGSAYETQQSNGVTNLIQHLALEATKSTSHKSTLHNGKPESREVKENSPQKRIDTLGGKLSALTARDSMFYSATVASPFLPQAVRALGAATLSPDLSDAKVEEVKNHLFTDIALNFDPIAAASDLAYATAFSSHPYRFSSQGNLATIAALTGKKVREYHQSRFIGSNISVILSGDLERETAHQLIAQEFSAARKTEASSQGSSKAKAEPALTKVLRSSQPGSLPVSVLTFGFRSPAIENEKDVLAADLLLSHWKEGSRSRLHQLLRLEKLDELEAKSAAGEESIDEEDEDSLPLALGFDVDYLTQRNSGLFLVSVIAPFDDAEVTGILFEEIAQLQNQGLSAEELSRAKTLLKQQYLRQSESLSGQGGALGFYEMINNYRFAETYLDRVARVTNEEVMHMARTYLKTDAHVQVTIEGRRPPVDAPDQGSITARKFEE